jgi:hypothetical protein
LNLIAAWGLLKVKRRKADNNKEKPENANHQHPDAVFSGYELPLDFEDVLLVAIANTTMKPKRKAAAGRNAPRRR